MYTLHFAGGSDWQSSCLPSGMAGFKRLEDIDAWKLSAELRDRVLEWTATGRVARDWDLRDQIRKSARSAPSNIAEGFGRFRPREFAHFVRIARASLLETLNHLSEARAQGLIDEALHLTMVTLVKRSLGATRELLRYLESCHPDPFHTGDPDAGDKPKRRSRSR
jgi:four helix bundle protein